VWETGVLARDCWSKQPKEEKEEQAFTTQEEATSLLFAEIEFAESLAPHRSGGDGWISSGDMELYEGGRRGMHASAEATDPTRAQAPEQKGALSAVQMHNTIVRAGEANKVVHIVEEKVYATSTPRITCRAVGLCFPASTVGPWGLSNSLMVEWSASRALG
jgi:hypothetical protein